MTDPTDTIATNPTDDAPLTTSKRDDAVERQTGALPDGKGDSIVARTVTINRPVSELFAYWRDFANLATFMENVVSIDTLDDTRSRWTVRAPAGRTVEWTARVTDEARDKFIAWTSEDDADIANSGRVDFRDAGPRGTIVTATIAYDPPGGVVGKVIAKLFQREPAIQARRDLRRFKQLMETGEIATSSFTRKQLEEEKA